MRQLYIQSRVALAALLALGVAACDDDSSSTLGPSTPGTTTSFSREIGFEDFQQRLSGETVRVEIKILPGGLVAREVELEEPEERFDEEEIESPVTAISASADAATLTLALGDLQVDFDRSSRLEEDDGDDLGFDEFVARIEDALAAGRQPFVEAKRPPPADPQAADDPTFFATRLELEDDDEDDLEIEINVDADNLLVNDTPPPDGWVAVLGLQIELRVSEGITELEEKDIDDDEELDDLEGLVESVDVGAGTFTLSGSGALIRIVDGTEIESESGDDDKLADLTEVQAALDAGLAVEAEVEGIVETTDPLVVIAIEVEFEVDDDDGDDDDDDDD